MNSLRIAASRPAPKTYGEGFIDGIADGYEQGRKESGLQLLVCGIFLGFLIGVALVAMLKP